MSVISNELMCPSCRQHCSPFAYADGIGGGCYQYDCDECGSFSLPISEAQKIICDTTGRLSHKLQALLIGGNLPFIANRNPNPVRFIGKIE